MPAFVDTFDRADGPLGSNWTVIRGTAAIVSNNLVTHTELVDLYPNTINEPGDTYNYWVLNPVVGAVGLTEIAIHTNGAFGRSVYMQVHGDLGGYVVTLDYWNGSSSVHLGDYTAPWSGGVAKAWGIRCVGSTYSVMCNGVSLGSVTGSYPCDGGRTQYGNRRAELSVASFNTGGYTPASMAVTPNPVWIGGGPVQLTATATATTWTIGVPGSSTLTCDHGSIVGQYTIDSTHINFTYLTDIWLGAVVFTDSEHGMTATINVTLTPPATAPWGLTLSPTAIAYIERSAVAEANPTIANRQMVVGGGPSMSMLDGLADLRSSVDDPTYSPSGTPGANRTAWLLWRILNGVNSPPRMPLTTPSDTTLKEDADAIQASLAALITSNHWTLGSVITEITGSGVPTIRDVLDALAELPAADLSTISSALTAMRGDTTTSLATLLSSLGGIRTVDALSLGDVMDALDNIGGSSPVPTALAVVGLIAALALAAPTGGASVAAAALAVGAGPVLDIATIVEIVSLAGEVASLIETITEMRANLITPYHGPPVWPGLDAVSLGELLTLTNGLVVTGPLDGLLFTITEQPEHNQRYLFGSTNSWSRVGAVIFETDNGYWERSQSIALDKHIIVPQTMSRAASAAVRMNANWHGTVRSWVTSP